MGKDVGFNHTFRETVAFKFQSGKKKLLKQTVREELEGGTGAGG